MYKSFGGKKSGGFSPRGGSGFGGKGGKRFGGGGKGGDWKPLFDAVCASCSNACQVPFKPNGRKPVLCSNCFKRDGGSELRGDSRSEFRKPAFNDRSESGSNVSAQLKEINDKLDAIIEALES